MVVASIRLPSSLTNTCLAPHRSPFSWRWRTSSILFPTPTLTPAVSPIHSRLYSSSANGDAAPAVDQAEIIFMGTGTSEGIPRVSCLTNPLTKCPVCSKAAEPGNKNRRLNTSILIRHPSTSGTHNILIDAGKFFYQSALRWFPAFGS